MPFLSPKVLAATAKLIGTESFEKAFATIVQGRDTPFRYAGALLAAKQAAGAKPAKLPSTRLNEGAIRWYPGDVTVRGDLRLDPTSIFGCGGTLTVEGAIIGDAADYSLVVAGQSIAAHDLVTAGEAIAGAAIRITRIAYLHDNDYSAMAPLLEAAVLVQDDRTDVFEDIRAIKHSKDDLPLAAALIGLPEGDDDLADRFREALASGAKLKPRKFARPRAAEPKPEASARAVDPHAVDYAGRTALHVAAQCGEDVRPLLKVGANANLADEIGWTPLHYAVARSGGEDTVRALLEAGADPNLPSTRPEPIFELPTGVTPTWLAGYRGHLRVLKRLLAGGGDPNVPNSNGESALFGAARSLANINLAPIVDALVAAGADPNHTNKQGKTARQLARKQPTVAAALTRHG